MKNIYLKKVQSLIVVLNISIASYASAPNWTVNEASVSNSMTITGITNVSGIELSSSNDIVAAFVGSECRGVAKLTPSTSLGHAFAYLMVMSNTNGEKLSFKIYRSSDGSIINVADNVVFTSDAVISNQETPYIFSDKPVSGASLTSFTIGVTGENEVIDSVNHTVVITVPVGTDITDLTPIISSSAGSQISIAGSVLTANTTVNLSQAVTMTIVSQNGMTNSSWQVTLGKVTGINTLNNKQYKVFTRTGKSLIFEGFPLLAWYSII